MRRWIAALALFAASAAAAQGLFDDVYEARPVGFEIRAIGFERFPFGFERVAVVYTPFGSFYVPFGSLYEPWLIRPQVGIEEGSGSSPPNTAPGGACTGRRPPFRTTEDEDGKRHCRDADGQFAPNECCGVPVPPAAGEGPVRKQSATPYRPRPSGHRPHAIP